MNEHAKWGQIFLLLSAAFSVKNVFFVVSAHQRGVVLEVAAMGAAGIIVVVIAA